MDASVVEELQTELREVRAALKSAFSVSEKLVAQCEKKNREIQEKTMAVKLARERWRSHAPTRAPPCAAANAERTSANGAPRTRRRRRARRASRRRDENARDESNAQRTAHARHHVERERQRRDESRGGVRRLARLGGIGVRGDFAEALASGGAFDALEYALDVFAADASVCRRALECVLCMSARRRREPADGRRRRPRDFDRN